jgi:hypothetical protein
MNILELKLKFEKLNIEEINNYLKKQGVYPNQIISINKVLLWDYLLERKHLDVSLDDYKLIGLFQNNRYHEFFYTTRIYFVFLESKFIILSFNDNIFEEALSKSILNLKSISDTLSNTPSEDYNKVLEDLIESYEYISIDEFTYNSILHFEYEPIVKYDGDNIFYLYSHKYEFDKIQKIKLVLKVSLKLKFYNEKSKPHRKILETDTFYMNRFELRPEKLELIKKQIKKV